MASLIVLGILALYGLFVLGVAYWGARLGYGEQKSRIGALLGGLIGFLLAAAPLGWDTVPTLIAFKEGCRTAGTIVFKDVDAWRRENPQIEPTISRKPGGYPSKLSDDGTTDIYPLSSRFAKTITRTSEPHLRVTLYRVTDLENGVVLAEQKLVSTGKGELKLYDRMNGLDDFKFWLNLGNCTSSGHLYAAVVQNYRNLGVEK